MSCDKYARMIIKSGSGIATIPASSDHRNGDWIATDIYDGEYYMDTDNGVIYTSNNGVIQRVGSNGNYLSAVLVLDQTGTNAPTVTELVNEIGTITANYTGVGQYTLTSSSLFTVGYTQVISQYFHKNSNYVECCAKDVDSSTILLKSKDNTLTLTNGILNNYVVEIRVYS